MMFRKAVLFATAVALFGAVGSAVADDTTTDDFAVPQPVVEPEAPAEKVESSVPKGLEVWQKVKVETLWYLAHAYGEAGGAEFDESYLGRGYLTLKFKQSDWFEPRVTFDAHQNSEGDWGVRLKYMYGKFKLPMESKFVTDPNVEVGLVHGPWFDYEEHINNYRMQGTMFIERNKVLNSADSGFTVGGLLGRKLPDDYQKKVSESYPGEYGSFAFGLYNGGGYHAEEVNKNKVFESRLSIRPGGMLLPNLQLSHFFVYGRGNIDAGPDWRLNALMASFEHQYFTLTAQYAMGKGNQKGDKLDGTGESVENTGYSVFAEGKLPQYKSTAIARYDHWEWDEAGSDRLIVGYAYHFLPGNFVLFDLDRVTYDGVDADDWQVKATVQVHYK